MDSKVWLIGAGEMGIEYGRVLIDLGIDFQVVGRGQKSANIFRKELGVDVIEGGLESYLSQKPELPEAAIVAVGVEGLSETTHLLLDSGITEILVEKPGVGYANEIDGLVSKTKGKKANVMLAYNRRFYSSVIKAKEIIKKDGGVTSFLFEFTEWSHIIKNLDKTIVEHHNWFLGNSTHVIDTAFYLGGIPDEISCFVAGRGLLAWHPTSSNFVGAGVTQQGALFSYLANWQSPGRWMLEFLTKNHRLIFKPMESLLVQEIGSVKVDPVKGIDYSLDKKYKPGLYLQTKAFLNQDYKDFCSIYDQKLAIKHYLEISGYNNG